MACALSGSTLNARWYDAIAWSMRPEVGLVERAELEVDRGAQPRLGRTLVGGGDGALESSHGAQEIAALAGQLRGFAIGIGRGPAARCLRLLQ